MEQKPADHFLPLIKKMSPDELEREILEPSKLLMEKERHGSLKIEVAYAPFDHINPAARLVVVGITPGRQQMGNALKEACKQLHSGAAPCEALAAVKAVASFSGSMRANLVAMLDDVGVNKLIGLDSTARLWTDRTDLVHFTSCMRYPVFVNGKNHSGSPDMIRVAVLRSQIDTYLVDQLRALPKAVFVPLGPQAGRALEYAAERAGLEQAQILSGLPHPSGANAERIAYFLGKKPREQLSQKTNPDTIDAARRSISNKVQKLGG